MPVADRAISTGGELTVRCPRVINSRGHLGRPHDRATGHTITGAPLDRECYGFFVDLTLRPLFTARDQLKQLGG